MWQMLESAPIIQCYQPRPIVKVDWFGRIIDAWPSMGDCCDAEGFSIKVLRVRLKRVEKYLATGAAYYYASHWERQGFRHIFNGQALFTFEGLDEYRGIP